MYAFDAVYAFNAVYVLDAVYAFDNVDNYGRPVTRQFCQYLHHRGVINENVAVVSSARDRLKERDGVLK